ncbi:MAG: SlyX family protein [Myxococcota bacterium]
MGDDRITELELELMAQRDLLETLNQELTEANARVEVLEKRAERLERQMENIVASLEPVPSEKPPHY